jgi:hypothetical protein
MARKKRPSPLKRQREYEKRERQKKKAEKAASKRERRLRPPKPDSPEETPLENDPPQNTAPADGLGA